MDSLSKNAKFLLLVAMLTVAGMSVANTFVNVFLIRATDGDIASMLLQTVISFLSVLVAFIWASRLLVKVSITTVLKMGIISTALFYVAILLLQDHVASFVIPLGIFSGLGMGLFAFATNLLVGEIVGENEQGRYFSYQQTAGFIFGVVTPAVSGFIITQFTDLTGYYLLFGTALVFFAFAIYMVRHIPGFKSEQQLRFLQVLKVKNNRYWKAGKLFAFITGLRNAVEGQFAMVFAFLIFADERIMGNVSSLVAVVSVLSSLWFAKVFMQKKQRGFYLITAIVMLLANVIIALFPYRSVLIGIWIVFAIVRNWGNTILNSILLQLCSRAKDGFEMREYQVGLEFPMALGRMIGLLCALGFVLFMPMEMIAYRFLFVFVGVPWILEFIVIDKQVKWLVDEPVSEEGETHG